jgi:anthranilate synthase component 1
MRVFLHTASNVPYLTYPHTQISVQPYLDDIHTLLDQTKGLANPPNLIPVCASISSEFLTPSAIYLKIAERCVILLKYMPD